MQKNLVNEMTLPELILNETNTAILVTNSHNEIIYTNAGFTRLFGFSQAEVTNAKPQQLLAGPYTQRHIFERITQHSESGKEFTEEVLLYHKSGESIWVSGVIKPLLDSAGQLQYVIATLSNINDAQLHESIQHKILQAIVGNDTQEQILALLCKQVEWLVPEANPSILKLNSNKSLDLLYCSERIFPLVEKQQHIPIGPNMGATAMAAWRGIPVLTENIGSSESLEPFREEAQRLGISSCWAVPILSHNSTVIGTFALYYTSPHKLTPFHQRLVYLCTTLCALILEREDYEREVHQLAYFDVMTGLANRVQLQKNLSQLIDSHKRNPQQQEPKYELAVLFFDIDNFKHVNDSLGHSAGDLLIKEVANRLKAHVTGPNFSARLGGDEFVVVLNGFGKNVAIDKANQLIELMSMPFHIEHLPIRVSISIGISLYPSDGFTQEMLLRHADMAMYKAKSLGKNRYCFFAPEMNTIAQEDLKIETALHKTLDHTPENLVLFYQPQLSLKSLSVCGAEALMRWHDPVLGNVPPQRFIPLAEKFSLIEKLGKWAIATACQQLSIWREQGIAPLYVSVNLSPLQLRDKSLSEFIKDTLQKYKLSAEHLRLEITESLIIDTRNETLKTLEELIELGIKFSLDDFGTGYTSMSYFKTMPIIELKIDKSFTKNSCEDEANQSLIIAIIRLTEKLKVDVVAEGIENKTQFNFLKANACDIGQGYYIAPPLSTADTSMWLEKTKKTGFTPFKYPKQ